VREVLTGLTVAPFLVPPPQIPLLHPGDPLDTVLERLGNSLYTALPVTDEEGRLLGMVSMEHVNLALLLPNVRTLALAADLMRGDINPLQPEDTLDRGLELFVENNLLELPVVENLSNRKLLGMVRRAVISATYLRHVHGAAAKEKAS
jgi:CBS domain-containing protein